jgi:5-methyltetrahydropteroyltriglutamate--homocysteine methyltransferase
MKRSEDRILTTHTGSLPRPPELTRLYTLATTGQPVDETELQVAAQAAVEDVIGRQIETGIDVINNGEQTREAFFLYVRNRVSGLGGSWNRPTQADVDRYPIFKERYRAANAARVAVTARDGVPKAIGRVDYLSSDAIKAESVGFSDTLKDYDGKYAEAFMSAPSPGILSTSILNEYYDSTESYLAALGAALRNEYEAIVGQGFILQIDAPDLGLERHVTFRDKPLTAFLDFAEMVVTTINEALANVPRDRVRMHVCWGNGETPHDCDVPLRDILPVLTKADVGGLVLPFANGRHAWEYRCMADHPLANDQLLVAGVIDTLTNVVEHPETVADRLVRIAEAVGDPRRVLAGTDCGFDTSAGAGRVASDVVWAKLASLSEGARLASGRLFKS